jgi:hypothetical protein
MSDAQTSSLRDSPYLWSLLHLHRSGRLPFTVVRCEPFRNGHAAQKSTEMATLASWGDRAQVAEFLAAGFERRPAFLTVRARVDYTN